VTRRLWGILALVWAAGFAASSALGMPVSLPSNLKNQQGVVWTHRDDRLEMTLDVETDFLVKKEVEGLDANFKANFDGLKLTFCPGNLAVDNLDFYLFAGKVYGMDAEAELSGSKVKFNLDDQFVGGAGLSNVFTPKSSVLQAAIRLQSRFMEGIDSGSSVTVGGVSSSGKSRLTWTELQGAVVLGWKLKHVVPYIGAKYSHLIVDAKVASGGILYSSHGRESEEAFGMFGGISIGLGDRCSLDIEMRFADESAYTLAFSVKF
jgi:hypothetical protein